MGIIIKQSSIGTLLTFFGMGLGYLNVLYFFPLYLSPEQIGLNRVIQDFAILMVPFAQLGVGQSLIRYYPRWNQRDGDNGAFLSLMLTIAILGFIVFMAVFILSKNPIVAIFAEKSPEVGNYLHLVVILTFILVINTTIVDYTRSLLNIVAPYFLREIVLRLLTTISIFLFVFGVVDFEGFLVCIVSAYGLNLLLISLFLKLRNQLRINLSFRGLFSSKELREIVIYGLFAFLGASATLVISKIDSLMISSMLGLDFNGIYATAFYMTVVIEVPRRAIMQISTPVVSKALSERRFDEVHNLYKKTSINQLVAGGLLFIGIWANIDNIYALVPNNEIFILGKSVVFIVGIGKLIDMGSGINGEIIILSDHYRVNALLTGSFALLTVILNLIFIPMYGIEGAALGTTLGIILFNLSKFTFLQIKMGFQPFSVKTILILLVGAVILWISRQIPNHEIVWMDIILRSSAITVVYTSLVLVFNVSEEINHVFRNIMKFLGLR